MKILFLGASRLVGLLERFTLAAERLRVPLEMFTLEDDRPWHAVGAIGLAMVIPGPRFDTDAFAGFLKGVVVANDIDIIIPNIDRATVAVAEAASILADTGATGVCCSVEVCRTMADKKAADAAFRWLQLPVPGCANYPLLAKPRWGASSRGIVRLNDAEERRFWASRNDETAFILQELIAGTEYSLDAYVSRTGRLVGCVCRTRDVVADGEVMVSRTKRVPEAEDIVSRLVSWGRWHGPLTVQVMHDGQRAWLLECNPRFGSGAPLSIEAGLDMPEFILREHIGLPLPESPLKWRDGLCMTRYRKEKFLWLS